MPRPLKLKRAKADSSASLPPQPAVLTWEEEEQGLRDAEKLLLELEKVRKEAK